MPQTVEQANQRAAQRPLWVQRLAARPPLATHWQKRHHCTDAVLGATHKDGGK